MTPHTPGPWTVGQAYRYGYSSGFCPIIGGNSQVAIVDTGDRYMPWASNIALIAAAPDMLAALRMAEKDLEWLSQDAGKDASSLAALRAAIAKAEGKA